MGESYKPITSMKEVPEQLRKLRRQYLRYQQAEIIYSILCDKNADRKKAIAETITIKVPEAEELVPMLCYEDIEQTSVEWLWFPYIPFGKLIIIQGNPGEGKTYFAMMLTEACTNRKLFPNMEDLSGK